MPESKLGSTPWLLRGSSSENNCSFLANKLGVEEQCDVKTRLIAGARLRRPADRYCGLPSGFRIQKAPRVSRFPVWYPVHSHDRRLSMKRVSLRCITIIRGSYRY